MPTERADNEVGSQNLSVYELLFKNMQDFLEVTCFYLRVRNTREAMVYIRILAKGNVYLNMTRLAIVPR